MGRICSNDELGKSMIKRLQLYRPTKQMAWFLEELKWTYDAIESRISTEKNPKQIERLKRAQEKLGNILYASEKTEKKVREE